jgi:spore germination cell wall hydrolase CwlJ-like protein
MRWIYGAILLLWCSSFYEPSPSLYNSRINDIACAAWTIYKEAAAEPSRGHRAVYDTLLERSKRSNKSICAVIAERGQFATYKKNREVTQDMLDLYAQAATMTPVAKGATHFYSGKEPRWTKSMEFVVKVGNHKFYRSK